MNTLWIIPIALVSMFLGSLLNRLSDRFLEQVPARCGGIGLFNIVRGAWLKSRSKPAFNPTTKPTPTLADNNTLPLRYPLGELTLMLLLPLTVHLIGWQGELAIALTLILGLYLIVQTDLAEMIIPNEVVLVCSIITLLLRIWIHPLPLWNYLLAALVCSGFLLLIGVGFEKLLRKEAMGGGDIKLYVFLGLVLGLKLTVLSLFLASFIGLLVLLPIQLFKNNRKSVPFPFGPFIAVGAWIAYLWGDSMVHWYLQLLV